MSADPVFTTCRCCGQPTDERVYCEACKDNMISQEEHDYERSSREFGF